MTRITTMTYISLPNVPKGVVCYLGTHRTPDGLSLDGFHVFTLEPGTTKRICRKGHHWVGVYSNAKTAAANARGL